METLRHLFSNGTGSAQPFLIDAGPSFRGTWGILISCLSTMLLCIWNAVHMNIPEHGGATRQVGRKIGWLVMGLLAPEMVAFTAWSQERSATSLLVDMRDILGQKQPARWYQNAARWPKHVCVGLRTVFSMVRRITELPQIVATAIAKRPEYPMKGCLYGAEGERLVKEYCLTDNMDDSEDDEAKVGSSPKRHKWSMPHSCYAVMGGFVFDTTDLEDNFLQRSPLRLTITPEGLRFLARIHPDNIPDLSEEEVLDKSKADTLKKLVVVCQATWFLVQTIVRMANVYPISLLELNTFAHALCALLVYYFWKAKPLDINEPTLITLKDRPDGQALCAYMSMMSNLDGRRELDIIRTAPEEDGLSKVRFDAESTGYNKSVRAGNRWTSARAADLRNVEQVRDRLKIPQYGWDTSATAQEKVCSALPEGYSVLQMGQSLYGLCFEQKASTINTYHHGRIRIGTGIFMNLIFSMTGTYTWVSRLVSHAGLIRDRLVSYMNKHRKALPKLRIPSLRQFTRRIWDNKKRQLDDELGLSVRRPFVTLTKHDIIRWRLASQAIEEHLLDSGTEDIKLVELRKTGSNDKDRFNTNLVRDMLVDRARNWAWHNYLPKYGKRDIPMWIAFTLAGFMYGALHLLAWYAPFRTPAQAILWKVSGILLLVSGPLFAALVTGNSLKPPLPSFYAPETILSKKFWKAYLYWYITALWAFCCYYIYNFTFIMIRYLAVGYLIARVYLVVESVLELSYLDQAVYQIPRWTSYIPHTGG